MTRIILLLFVFVLCHLSIYANYTIIEIPSISSTSTFYQTQTHISIAAPFMESTVPGQIIAVKLINNRTDILPNHKLQLGESSDCRQDPLKAIRNAIEVIQDSIHSCNSDLTHTHLSNQTIIQSPIVLCCPWSAFSVVTAPIFEEFDRIQISSSSTAYSLSESPSFFRTIAQADNYVPLCKYFGWKKIAVLYVNDFYGVDHKNAIVTKATAEHIAVESIPYSYGTNVTTRADSLKQAAALIQKLELYIIIILSNSADVGFILRQFKQNNILQYPYYYMFQITHNSLKVQELGDLAQGFLATQPFFPALTSKQQYVDFNVSGDNLTIWEVSNNVYSAIKSEWRQYYNTSPSMVYYAPEPHDYTVWGFDSLYAAALTLDYLIASGFNLFDYNATKLVDAMRYYLTNKLSFIGATGLVEMDQNGDRMHDYYLYGYINGNGELDPVGVFGSGDSDQTIKIDVSVVFPMYFNGKSSEVPLSEPITYVTSVTVLESVYWSVLILCTFFIIAILSCIILIFKERTHPIIAKSSYKLSIITSVGCILGLVLIATQRIGSFSCVVTWYGYSAVFTLIFMPIFARLYRLHIIMHRNNVEFITSLSTLIERQERKLNKGILAMFLLDVILFLILTGIHFINGNITTLGFVKDEAIRSSTDPLLITQNEYESCQINNIQVSTAFDVLIIVYKLIQFGFGMYYFLSIFRLKYQTPINDEISAVLLSIVLSIIIFVILSTFGLANSNSDITTIYALNSFMIMLLIIFIMLLNVCLRLYYRYKFSNNALQMQQYGKSPEEIMRDEFVTISDGGVDGPDLDEDVTELYSHQIDSAQILGSTNIHSSNTVSPRNYVQVQPEIK